MNMKFKIVGLIHLLVLSVGLKAQDYTVRHFNPENGLNGTYIYTTTEDVQGFKWVGTDYGLSRFNGLQFETFDLNDSTKSNFPTAMISTSDGQLFIGYYNGVIKKFNGIDLNEVYKPDSHPSAIKALVESENGLIWTLTQNNGVIKVEGEKIILFELDELKNRRANTMILDKNQLLIGTNDGLLTYEVSDGILNNSGRLVEFDGMSIQTIVGGQEKGTSWVGTDHEGVFRLNQEKRGTGKLGYDISAMEFLRETSIVSISEAKNKDLWVGTKYDGLVRVNFNRDNSKSMQFTFINQDNGFPGDKISTLILDANENVWVGTIGDGLAQITKKGLIFYNFEKFRAKSVHAISGSSHHQYFFGTDKGLIRASYVGDSDSLNFELVHHDLLRDHPITAIYTDPQDRVYFGIENKGLYYSDTNFNQIRQIQFDINTSGLTIRHIAQDQEGMLWVSVKKNGVLVLDPSGRVKHHYSTKSGFYHNEIYHIQIDSKGNKWFAAHSAGLAVLRPNGELTYLSKEGIFPARDINDISEDESGNLWIGTYGNGVYEYDGVNFVRFGKEEGLLNSYTNSVMSDRNNHIWVGHRLGLSRIDEGSNAISTIQEKDGLQVSEFIHNSIFRDHDHNIWLGNRNGVTLLNTPDEMFESKMLKTIVTDVKVDHESVDLYQFSSDLEGVGKIPTQLTFPYDQNNLTFEYIAINLSNPQSNLYEFQLEGYDNDWSPITQDNSISYTNLEPGSYTFLVRQSDNPNHWSDDNITRIPFVITPSWWNTWWARAVFLITGSLFIYGLVSFRLRRLNERMEEKMKLYKMTETQNKRLMNFSFITSHNTKASVVNILGLIEIMERDPDNQQYFKMLKDSAIKLNVTIENLNKLLEFENTSQVQKFDCNVLEVVRRSLTLHSEMIERKGANIELDIPDTMVVHSIPSYMDSVFSNLITNAVRYGTTELSKKIKISSFTEDKKNVVRIQDYGLGIDMNLHGDRLFELGSRFHSSKSDGQGLGLFMTKNQIEAMNAKIVIESAVDEGTTVEITFPIEDS